MTPSLLNAADPISRAPDHNRPESVDQSIVLCRPGVVNNPQLIITCTVSLLSELGNYVWVRARIGRYGLISQLYSLCQR